MKYKSYKLGNNKAYSIIKNSSPYYSINIKRLKDPKYIFRYCEKFLNKKLSNKKPLQILDIGCANGEFINFLYSKHPHHYYTGIDIHKDFISLAKDFHKKKNIKYVNIDFLKFNGKFDIIFFMGTFPIFSETKKPLSKLVNLLNKKGTSIIEGRFNKFNCDVILNFRDRSINKKNNLWRCDFNIHSEESIIKNLKKISNKISYKFEHKFIDKNINFNRKNPHTYAYTFKDSKNNFRITSGLHQLMDPSFLILKNN